ncbi:MAG TPA: hypothetical protein VGM41_21965 [Chitinophagaceae bacterium]|jgi:hypothetical protein
MQTLPLYVPAFFGLTAIAVIGLFYKAANRSKTFLVIVSLWVVFQSVLGVNGFYKIDTTPPRFLLLASPPVLFLLIGLIIPRGRRFIDSLDLKTLTVLNTLRIPVEIVLYWLFLNNAVPGAMTFEGRNFDILSGISALPVLYFGFRKGRLNKPLLLVWNLVCLGLLLNVVTIAVLSAAAKWGQSAFDQPKFALVYFPFLLLPGCLVPLVLTSNVAAIRQLLKR